MKNKLLFPIAIFFIFMTFSCLVASQIGVSSHVDKTKISLDEIVQFIITIEGIDDSFRNPKIKLPQLEDDFNIVATSQSSSINLKSGKTTISWQLQYSLSPKREGEIKIKSAEIIYKSETYKTEEITVIVTPAKSPKKLPQKIPSKKVPWSKEGITI